MKIIDLLNKIANGEEVPKKIKIFGHIFFYTRDKRPQRFYRMDTQDNYLLRDFVYTLDSEVEILEEETKPLTKQDVEALGYACGEIQKCFTNGWNKSLENKPFKEDKKIEKLDSLNTDYYAKEVYYERLSKEEITLDIQTLKHWINKIIDYLMENKQ